MILFIVKTVRDLEVTLDSELSVQRHVNKVASYSTCFHHIRRLKQVDPLLGRHVTHNEASFCVHSTTVTQCWLVYQNLQLLHSIG